MTTEAAIAAVRFGLGAGPGEIDDISRATPKHWLDKQLSFNAGKTFPGDKLKSSKEDLGAILNLYAARARGNRNQEIMRQVRLLIRDSIVPEITARCLFASRTPAPFHERLTQFWSNHFSISTKSTQLAAIAGAYEREAIRPNILGSFNDLLHAAVLHPAMLLYLDNMQSFGPNSRVGRRSGRGLNENLAREVMELHSLSSTGGYSQADVTEFARALTGWSIGNPRFETERLGETVFFEPIHEPGTRTVMGKKYPDTGRDQALAVLDDLARNPHTAKHIATKLARHFTADTPSPSLVAKLTAAFLDSNGDLPTVYRTLIEAPEPWAPDLQKIKTPNELLTSAARMLDLQAVFAGRPKDVFDSLAQRPFSAPSPQGWPDTADAWLGPDSVMKRVEWANQVAGRAPVVDARAFLDEALGPLVSGETRQTVARAESRSQALVLAMMSPEFQRR